MIGGEINVIGTVVSVPFNERIQLLDNYLDVMFNSDDSRLILCITEEQAFELVRQLTDYLGKSTGAKFKRSLTKGKEVTF